MRFTTLLLALVTVAGCASVPMASADRDAAGKAFEPPPAGRAALYVFRETIFQAVSAFNVSMGQRNLGSLAPDTWLLVDVEPGAYELRCSGGENADTASVTVAPGETRFVEVAARFGFGAARCAIFEVQPEAGRRAVYNGHRAAEIK